MYHHCRDACLPDFHEFHEIQFRELGIFNNKSSKQFEIGLLGFSVVNYNDKSEFLAF